MLIFDFDGVMLDSVDEVAVTAYNTESGSLAQSLEELPDGYLELFRRNRFHVQPAADFVPFARWCLAHCRAPETLLSSEQYSTMLDGETAPFSERRGSFFSTRGKFVEANISNWLSLNRPCQPLWDALKADAGSVIVLTNKNGRAVLDLAQHYDLSLNSDNVYAADGGASKLDNFRTIQQRFPSEKLRFIDDSVKNLAELREHISEEELDMLFADWGYCGPDDAADAEARGFEVYSQDRLVADLQRL